MGLLRKSRWMLLALLLSLVPASSYAGVFISVGIAPPVLPVYVQPPCPEPGLMWTPATGRTVETATTGFRAHGFRRRMKARCGPWLLGLVQGLYVFHGGYWGPHVGYYGGVNYGFGYMGVGFAGGVWRGGVFAYNTAVVHVNTDRHSAPMLIAPSLSATPS